MNLLFGKPAPQFVVKKTGYVDNVFRLTGFKDYDFKYMADEIEHEVGDEGELKTKLRGQRYEGHIYYEGADGLELAKCSRLLHQTVHGSEQGYDQILIYPHIIDMPEFSIDIKMTGDVAVQYWKLLAHKDFELNFKSRKFVDWPPLALPTYDMIARMIYPVNAAARDVDFPFPLSSDDYWFDVGAVSGEYIGLTSWDQYGFKSLGSEDVDISGIARYLAVSFLCDAIVGSKIRVGRATIGTESTHVAFSTPLTGSAVWFDARGLAGEAIELLAWDKNGFDARTAVAGTLVNYVAFDESLTSFEQSEVRVKDAAIGTAATMVTWDTPLPAAEYYLKPKGMGGEFIEVLSQDENGFTAKTEVACNARALAVYQEY